MKALLLNRILLALAFIGLFIAGYMSLATSLGATIPCGATGDCKAVTESAAGKWFGQPVAYFGLIGYVLLAALATIRSVRGVSAAKSFVMPGYWIAAIGTVASLYLQYQSIFVLHKICPWCLGSALTMVISLVMYALLAQVSESETESPKDPIAVPYLAGLAVAVIAGLVFGRSSLISSGAAASQPTNVNKSVELVPKDANVYGDPNAPITLIEFADIYCPSCRSTSPKLHDFVKQNPGKVRLVYRHFPLVQKHQMAVPAALIAEAAADQGKFWDFLLAAMTREEVESEQSADSLYLVARSVGLDPDALKKRIDDVKDPIYTRLQRDMQAADKLGLRVTPSILIQQKGKTDYDFATSNDIFEKLQKSPYKELINAK